MKIGVSKVQTKWPWWLVILVSLIFLISRVYVLKNPPYHQVVKDSQVTYEGYSDVKQDSERYANMWYYGLTPYRQHLFEYPPAAIPLMFGPLLVDQAGIGYYYLDYRVQIFLLECLLFAGIFYTIIHLPLSQAQQWLALGFYISAGVLAKDFWYDGLDLAFFGSFTLAIIWRLWHDYRKLVHRIIFWALLWLSVAIKLLTLPLLLPFGWLKRREWKKELLACVLGGLLVWGAPLVLYRSSLSVFLFFHAVRPLKYEAFGSFVIRTVNDFTHTETVSTLAPHFPMIGPVSTGVEKTVAITFPLVILGVIGWSIWSLAKLKVKEPEDRLVVFQWLIKITLVYLFALFLSSKILSRPFHIWYVPLIAIYPFKNLKTQLMFIIGALLMLALDTSPYLKVPPLMVGPLSLDRIRDLCRFLPMAVLLYLSVKLPVRREV